MFVWCTQGFIECHRDAYLGCIDNTQTALEKKERKGTCRNMETLVKYSTLAKWRALYLASFDVALVGKLILWVPPLKIMLMRLFTSSSRIVDLFVCIIKAPNCPISKAWSCPTGSIFNAGELGLTTIRSLWTTNSVEC